MDTNLTEKQVRDIIKDEMTKREKNNAFNVSLIPYHAHTGVDSPQINSADVIETYPPYAGNVVYTSDQTVTFSPGFKPQNILAYGYAGNTTGAFNFAVMSGSGDYISATSGICSGQRTLFNSGTGALVDFNVVASSLYLLAVPGLETTVSAKITAWSQSSITVAIKCAANWTIGFALSITG